METFLQKWTSFIARWPLVVIAFWLVLVAAVWVFSPSIDSVAATQNNTSSLPASALSNQAAQIYATKFANTGSSLTDENDLIVLTNPQGIGSQDLALAEQIENWLTTTRPAHFVSVAGPSAQAPVTYFKSQDGQALRLVLTWDSSNSTVLGPSVQQVATYLAHQQPAQGGLLGITGATPIQNDTTSNLFTTGGGSFLGLLLILVVLVLVYRSPLAVIVPLLTIGLAIGLAIPLIAWAGKIFGIAVASFSLEYVIFVLLGAGTNYGVFMLSRYREELRRRPSNDKQNRRGALAYAVGHVGESIASSALTVVVAMAIMGFAQLYLLRVTGPAIAIGVVCLLLAGLSLLPAFMALFGRALFWPVKPRPGSLSEQSIPTKGFWVRTGSLVTKYAVVVTVVVLLILVPLAISSVQVDPSFDNLKSVPSSSPSVQAFNTYSAHFNDAAQVKVLISSPGHDLRQSSYSDTLSQLSSAFSRVAHVSAVQTPTTAQSAQPSFSTDGSVAAVTVSIDVDPYSLEARQTVGGLYTTAASVLHGTALSGAQVAIDGLSSQVYDEAIQFGNDFTLIIILVSIAIFIILMLLVRSVTAPIYLLATIALSSLSAVGLTNLVFHVALGEPIFQIVPIFAIVFLVSLGEDFNILTISRIREEVQKLGHKRGIATAIALTGGTVSSCGLVMAASFSRLATNVVVEIAQLGFTVVVGILLDTFLVRPLLVPAIASLLGRWNWVWPGSALFKKGALAATPAEAPEAVTPLDLHVHPSTSLSQGS